MTPVQRHDLRLAAEDFLHREARLLDTHSYADWEAMWTDDGVYWVPVGNADYDPKTRVSLIYEERPALSRRVKRLCGDSAYAQIPRSSMVRIVSNVEVDGSANGNGSENGTVDVHSTFVLHSSRRDIQDVFAGRVHHVLRTVEGSWRIARRTVVLIDGDEPVPNLSFII